MPYVGTVPFRRTPVWKRISPGYSPEFPAVLHTSSKNVLPVVPQAQHIWIWIQYVSSKFLLLFCFISRLLALLTSLFLELKESHPWLMLWLYSFHPKLAGPCQFCLQRASQVHILSIPAEVVWLQDLLFHLDAVATPPTFLQGMHSRSPSVCPKPNSTATQCTALQINLFSHDFFLLTFLHYYSCSLEPSVSKTRVQWTHALRCCSLWSDSQDDYLVTGERVSSPSGTVLDKERFHLSGVVGKTAHGFIMPLGMTWWNFKLRNWSTSETFHLMFSNYGWLYVTEALAS